MEQGCLSSVDPMEAEAPRSFLDLAKQLSEKRVDCTTTAAAKSGSPYACSTSSAAPFVGNGVGLSMEAPAERGPSAERRKRGKGVRCNAVSLMDAVGGAHPLLGSNEGVSSSSHVRAGSAKGGSKKRTRVGDSDCSAVRGKASLAPGKPRPRSRSTAQKPKAATRSCSGRAAQRSKRKYVFNACYDHAESWVQLFELMSCMGEFGQLQVNSNGLFLSVTDGCCVSMMTVTLHASGFCVFKCEKALCIGVHAKTLLTIMRSWDKACPVGVCVEEKFISSNGTVEKLVVYAADGSDCDVEHVVRSMEVETSAFVPSNLPKVACEMVFELKPFRQKLVVMHKKLGAENVVFQALQDVLEARFANGDRSQVSRIRWDIPQLFHSTNSHGGHSPACLRPNTPERPTGLVEPAEDSPQREYLNDEGYLNEEEYLNDEEYPSAESPGQEHTLLSYHLESPVESVYGLKHLVLFMSTLTVFRKIKLLLRPAEDRDQGCLANIVGLGNEHIEVSYFQAPRITDPEEANFGK